MRKETGLFWIIGLVLVLLAPVAMAAVTNTTTMSWVVPSNKSHTVAYGGSCSSSAFYFIESNSPAVGGDPDIDGNGSKVLPYNAASGGTACQSASVAGMTVTNNGNVTINIDANFQTGLSGNDQNVGIKVWMGSGPGAGLYCGTGGLGGWQLPCGVQSTASPVTSTTCRDFNILNFTTTARLTSNLGVLDTNQLCFSGEFNGAYVGLSQGTITRSFDTNAS